MVILFQWLYLMRPNTSLCALFSLDVSDSHVVTLDFWLGENPAIPFSLKQILKDTKEVRSWYPLGIQLGIGTSDLKRIEIYYAGHPERCKIEVIDFWLRNDPEPTWNKLAHAVEDMGGHAYVVETLRANHEGL